MTTITATKRIILCMMISLCAITANAQSHSNATLRLVNHSDHTLTVKIMKQDGGLHTTVYLQPRKSSAIYFEYSGNFYTKTKAEKVNDFTVYKKGNRFNMYCERDGYSQSTLEFYVSSGGNTGMGATISKSEFEKNY